MTERSSQAGFDVRFEGQKAFIIVDKPLLYNIIDGEYDNYRLDLKVLGTNKSFYFSFNAFTFG